MDELIKRLNESIAAAKEIQAEQKDKKFINGMIAGFSSALQTAKDVKKEGMYNEY